MTNSAAATGPRRILIVGGGYVGMYTALRLQKELRHGEAEVVVVDTRSYMTYQPFLPEAAAGSLEPRHVVVPLRRVLPKCRVITGEVTRIVHAERRADIEPHTGEPFTLTYDQVVVAVGSVARTLPIPGLADWGIGFKRVEEAIYLRNKVIDQLDSAASETDPAKRRADLTFVFVGGGYAGVEAFAELEDMAREAVRRYFSSTIRQDELRWVLVEATGRILPEVGEELGRYTVEQLRKRGMDIRLETLLKSAVDGHIVLSDGDEFDAGTLVWTAGVKPHPLLANTDLPVDERGRLKARATLQVEGVDGAWTAGDCAAVPDLTQPGKFTGPSAQHAVRQARLLAPNIVAAMRGFPVKEYRHAYAGSVASLGLYKGVAQIKGVKLKGYPAWLMHRTYHLSRVPTFNRKVRALIDWTLALVFRREIVSLGTFSEPREEFMLYAVRPQPAPAGSADERPGAP